MFLQMEVLLPPGLLNTDNAAGTQFLPTFHYIGFKNLNITYSKHYLILVRGPDADFRHLKDVHDLDNIVKAFGIHKSVCQRK